MFSVNSTFPFYMQLAFKYFYDSVESRTKCFVIVNSNEHLSLHLSLLHKDSFYNKLYNIVGFFFSIKRCSNRRSWW